uniref:V-SNARE coiled-coil homology domain-containing protein n=1 Tax=Lates calcarifer TaxID=8187 RepID=A0A4W6G6D5_LATCA
EAPQNKLQALNDQLDGHMIQVLLEDGCVAPVDCLVSLPAQAEQFKRTTKTVTRSYWWKNVKLIVVIVLVALIISVLIILLATGVIPVSAPVPPTVIHTSHP